MLAELMPDEPEVLGLLALMELQASRAATRADADGNIVLLADQDRSRWDRAQISRGLACLERAGPIERAGPYQRQAAIAACHARAASWEATEWRQIVQHYDALAAIAPSPVVELNRAVAIGLAHGPEAGLTALDRIDAAALHGYHLLSGARADFLRRLGRSVDAAAEYRRALGLTDNARERAFYAGRLAACEAGESASGGESFRS
jgi:predicted RNA polymerase sigma factor